MVNKTPKIVHVIAKTHCKIMIIKAVDVCVCAYMYMCVYKFICMFVCIYIYTLSVWLKVGSEEISFEHLNN